MKFLWPIIFLVCAACSSQKKDDDQLPLSIEEAVAAKTRTPENKSQDAYRHPAETLKFFGVEPEMTVVEIAPGEGWYMEILAPMLSEKGQYIMAAPPGDKANDKKISDWKMRNPKVASKVKSVMFNPPSDIHFPDPGSVDMVLTFRDVHTWLTDKGEKQAFKAFYDVLKPGGILGVVEYRASAVARASRPKSRYLKETDVIAMAQLAGFKLVEKSEINASPTGAPKLPGESDRMTLKFAKPKK